MYQETEEQLKASGSGDTSVTDETGGSVSDNNTSGSTFLRNSIKNDHFFQSSDCLNVEPNSLLNCGSEIIHSDIYSESDWDNPDFVQFSRYFNLSFRNFGKISKSNNPSERFPSLTNIFQKSNRQNEMNEERVDILSKHKYDRIFGMDENSYYHSLENLSVANQESAAKFRKTSFQMTINKTLGLNREFRNQVLTQSVMDSFNQIKETKVKSIKSEKINRRLTRKRSKSFSFDVRQTLFEFPIDEDEQPTSLCHDQRPQQPTSLCHDQRPQQSSNDCHQSLNPKAAFDKCLNDSSAAMALITPANPVLKRSIVTQGFLSKSSNDIRNSELGSSTVPLGKRSGNLIPDDVSPFPSPAIECYKHDDPPFRNRQNGHSRRASLNIIDNENSIDNKYVSGPRRKSVTGEFFSTFQNVIIDNIKQGNRKSKTKEKNLERSSTFSTALHTPLAKQDETLSPNGIGSRGINDEHGCSCKNDDAFEANGRLTDYLPLSRYGYVEDKVEVWLEWIQYTYIYIYTNLYYNKRAVCLSVCPSVTLCHIYL